MKEKSGSWDCISFVCVSCEINSKFIEQILNTCVPQNNGLDCGDVILSWRGLFLFARAYEYVFLRIVLFRKVKASTKLRSCYPDCL